MRKTYKGGQSNICKRGKMIVIKNAEHNEFCNVCLAKAKLYTIEFHCNNLIHCVVLCKNCMDELKSKLNEVNDEGADDKAND